MSDDLSSLETFVKTTKIQFLSRSGWPGLLLKFSPPHINAHPPGVGIFHRSPGHPGGISRNFCWDLRSRILSFRATQRPSDRAIDRATDRATERPSDRAIDRATERSTERPSDRATERSTERSSDRATERSSDRSSDRAIDRSVSGQVLSIRQ